MLIQYIHIYYKSLFQSQPQPQSQSPCWYNIENTDKLQLLQQSHSGRLQVFDWLLNSLTRGGVRAANVLLNIGVSDIYKALCNNEDLSWKLLNKPLKFLQHPIVKQYRYLTLQMLCPITAFLPVEIGYLRLIFGSKYDDEDRNN